MYVYTILVIVYYKHKQKHILVGPFSWMPEKQFRV